MPLCALPPRVTRQCPEPPQGHRATRAPPPPSPYASHASHRAQNGPLPATQRPLRLIAPPTPRHSGPSRAVPLRALVIPWSQTLSPRSYGVGVPPPQPPPSRRGFNSTPAKNFPHHHQAPLIPMPFRGLNGRTFSHSLPPRGEAGHAVSLLTPPSAHSGTGNAPTPAVTSTHTTWDRRPIPPPKGIKVFGKLVHPGTAPLAPAQPLRRCRPGSFLLHGFQVPGPMADPPLPPWARGPRAILDVRRAHASACAPTCGRSTPPLGRALTTISRNGGGIYPGLGSLGPAQTMQPAAFAARFVTTDDRRCRADHSAIWHGRLRRAGVFVTGRHGRSRRL